MIAKELTVGQKFHVVIPDPEGPVRVCLENDGHIIVWGFPDKPAFWNIMGAHCQVWIIDEKGRGAQ